MFAEVLHSITNKVEGTQAAIVMGMDGISIEKRLLNGGSNVEAVAAEYTSLLKASSSAARDIGLGNFEEFIVSTDTGTVVVRMITPGYFLLVLLNRQGNVGRARFELKKAQALLSKELEV